MLHFGHRMTTAGDVRSALALIVAGRDVVIPKLPPGCNSVIERAGTAAIALEVARDTRPEVVLVAAGLADMPASLLCRRLRAERAVGRNVPILQFTTGAPSADERVSALRAGVWDVIRLPQTGEELALTLRVYAQANWNLAEMGTSEFADQDNHARSAGELARQAERLGGLMSRLRGGLACVVFEMDNSPAEFAASNVIAGAARKSDVVGALGPRHVGVLAPATAHEGAVLLAVRLSSEVHRAIEAGKLKPRETDRPTRVLAGFDAVSNARYSPVDPVGLIQRAAAAARSGAVEPGHMWLRRHREEPVGDANDLATVG
jgi:CheY-like chemotaxis protein